MVFPFEKGLILSVSEQNRFLAVWSPLPPSMASGGALGIVAGAEGSGIFSLEGPAASRVLP